MARRTRTELQEALAQAEARILRLEARDTSSVHTPTRAAKRIRAYLGDIGALEQEHFVVAFLTSRQKVLKVSRVAQGSLAQVDVHPREVFRDAIRLAAHSVILAHNHPSEDAEPSEADVELTRRMVEVGRLVGIPVLDHLIITADETCSLGALGLVPWIG